MCVQLLQLFIRQCDLSASPWSTAEKKAVEPPEIVKLTAGSGRQRPVRLWRVTGLGRGQVRPLQGRLLRRVSLGVQDRAGRPRGRALQKRHEPSGGNTPGLQGSTVTGAEGAAGGHRGDRTDGTGLPCCGGKHVSLSTMGAKEDAGSPGKGHCHNLGVG